MKPTADQSLLPIAQRWGGGPLSEAEWWRGFDGEGANPSTMSLRVMVPLPTGCAGREERI